MISTDLIGAGVMLFFGCLALFLTKEFQSAIVLVHRATPRWLRGPIPAEFYESRVIYWFIKFFGAGCLVGAIGMVSWFLEDFK